jgi:hypothetical protein
MNTVPMGLQVVLFKPLLRPVSWTPQNGSSVVTSTRPPMIVSLLSWFALLMLLFPLWEPLLGSKAVGKLTGSVPTALNRFPLSLLRIMSLAIIRFCPSRLIP